MPKCKDCKHYRPKDDEKGDCFGYEVFGDTDAEKCPSQSFLPKDEA